jgi:signal transduction histidine kinase
MRRVRWLALCVATALVVLLAVAVAVEAARRPAEAVGDGGAGALVLQVAAGVALWFAGLQLALRQGARASGWLLAAAGPALLAGALPLPRAGGAVLFGLALALGLTAPALAGAAALLHPTPAHRRDPAIAGAAVAAAVAAGLVPLLIFDPRATGCFECPRNLLLLHEDAGLHDSLLRDGLLVSAVACAVVAAAAALGLARRPVLVRRVAAPVAAPALVAAGLGAAMLAHDARVGSPALDATTRTLWLLLCGALLLAAAGVASEAVRVRLLRRRVAAHVVAALPAGDELQAALAAALGDPGLRVVFVTGSGMRVDATGQSAGQPAPGVAVTEIHAGGELVAELHHDAALAAGDRVAAVARGAALGLQHAALRARLRAELAELDASRARVVEAADGERRRLERNLHDGAQQRLIALTVALADDPVAQGEMRAALAELREIAHGIHPVSLSDAGLAAAVRDIADGSRVPVRIGAVLSERVPAPVEAATHRLVSDAVLCAERDGDGRAVEVEIERMDGLLRARMRLPGVDPERATVRLEQSADRFAALGGRLAIGTGAVIDAELPCGS